MSTINLIPPTIKKEQHNKKIAQVVFSTLFALSIIAIFIFVAVFGINYYLKSILDNTRDELARAEAMVLELKPIEDDVNSINAKIQKVDTLQKDIINWDLMLVDVNSSVPELVKIESLSIDRKDKTISMNGLAETRREIVRLQEKMNSLKYFDKLNFSSSTFSESYAAYSFSLSGEVVE